MKMQKKLGAAVLSLGLVVGLSGFAGATSGAIDTTGPDSTNTIRSDSRYRVDVDNDNNLRVHNDNDQDAWTGDAEVRDNTRGGDAGTGAAMNENAFDAEVTVDNSASGAAALGGGNGGSDNEATIENTGPDSVNRVNFDSRTNIDIQNDNNLYVHNDNNQTASSGDATVKHNTTGGDATTGDATNTNMTSVKFNVTN
ncbi:MAG: hypothetical protein JWM07_544 [Candidatus Saccharibacteria bacterium]|nr:hypothetical protein [Candidatus Saccharibacteria bacterium]